MRRPPLRPNGQTRCAGWPSGLTASAYRDIERVLFLIRKLEDMARELKKTYDEGFSDDRTA
jgi:hypothetical protein